MQIIILCISATKILNVLPSKEPVKDKLWHLAQSSWIDPSLTPLVQAAGTFRKHSLGGSLVTLNLPADISLHAYI